MNHKSFLLYDNIKKKNKGKKKLKQYIKCHFMVQVYWYVNVRQLFILQNGWRKKRRINSKTSFQPLFLVSKQLSLTV